MRVGSRRPSPRGRGYAPGEDRGSGAGCRPVLALLLLIMILPALAGCWSRHEIEDLAVVGAAALDAAPGAQVRLSVFITYPRAIAGGPSMGGGGGGGEPQRVGEVVSATGADFAEAARRLEEMVPRRLFWAQNHVLIIGEELARRGLHYLDFFSRERQMRLTMLVLITSGEARQVVGLSPGVELVPGTILTGIVRNKTTFKVKLKDLLAMWEAPGDNAVIPRVVMTPAAGRESRQPGGGGGGASQGGGQEGEKKQPPEAVAIKGAGAFRDDRLAGWLDEEETDGLMWVRGEVQERVVTVSLPDQLQGGPAHPDEIGGQTWSPAGDAEQGQRQGDTGGQGQSRSDARGESGNATREQSRPAGGAQGQVSIILHHINTRITPRVEGQQLTFEVAVRGRGDLHESTANLHPDRQEDLQAIQEAVNREVGSRIQAAIRKAQQELHADIFGFGETLHRSNARYWRQVQEHWNEEFTRVPVQVQVDLSLRRMGLTNRPPGKTGATGGKGSTLGSAR